MPMMGTNRAHITTLLVNSVIPAVIKQRNRTISHFGRSLMKLRLSAIA